MELYQIRYFLALCDTLNFGRAAEKCGVSQPSLTRAVQKLEAELGGILIRRERRLTSLTELGRLVHPMMKEVLLHAESTKSAAQRFTRIEHKPVKLGIMPSIGPASFAPFLARFSREHAEVEISIVEADATRLLELLLGGAIDLAIGDAAGSAHDRLRTLRLYLEPMVAVFPADHRFARQVAVRLAELAGEHLLLRAGCEKREIFLARCRKLGFEPRVDCVHRDDWIQMIVAAGGGIAVVPRAAHLSYGTLARPIVEPDIVREVALITVAGRPYQTGVGLLIRAMRAQRWSDETQPRLAPSIVAASALMTHAAPPRSASGRDP